MTLERNLSQISPQRQDPTVPTAAHNR